MWPPSASPTCVILVARRGISGSRDTASNDLSFQTARSSVPPAAGFPHAPRQPYFHGDESSRALPPCPSPHVQIPPLPELETSFVYALVLGVKTLSPQKMRRAAHAQARRHTLRGWLRHTFIPRYPIVDFLPSPVPPAAAASEPRHPRPLAVRRSCESSLLPTSARRRKMRPAPLTRPGRCSYRMLQ